MRLLSVILIILVAQNSGCKRALEASPPIDQIVFPFKNDTEARAAISGIYEQMMEKGWQFTNSTTTLVTGLSADELYYYSPNFGGEFYNNRITSISHPKLSEYFWAPAYRFIYTANLILEQLKVSTTLSTNFKAAIEGEARFVRAFCYFYLTSLFGDVPLLLISDYRKTSATARTSTEIVYKQIVEDLEEANRLFHSTASQPSHTRPGKWACLALLARVYLFQQKWTQAEAVTSEIINSGKFALLPNLDSVFLKNSTEAIWQLQPVNPFYNTYEGNYILPAAASSLPTFLLTPSLLKAFGPADKRRKAWIKSRTFSNQLLYYPSKYKVYGNFAPVTEHYTVFRLAEIYLIRAEANAHQGRLPAAHEDLNKIRSRAGLGDAAATNENSMTNAILQERRVELFAEWGHRWIDLKREGNAVTLLSETKGLPIRSTDLLYPIPEDQIKTNPNLTQNPGY